MKSTNKSTKSASIEPLPTTMAEAKKVCTDLCKSFGLRITFDDKWGNFGTTWNQCCTAGSDIECAFFQDWNYDLLVFAVCHEIGHFRQIQDKVCEGKNKFFLEFDAWHKAIKFYTVHFGQNISIKQARYMMKCLNSYMPNYNDCERAEQGIAEVENNFWCPKTEKVIKK